MRQPLAPRVSDMMVFAASFALAGSIPAQGPVPGQVLEVQKVSATEGGFTGQLQPLAGFGFSLARLGDLDGNGVDDLAAGSPFDDDGGLNRGAVWILFMSTDGTVMSQQKISSLEGLFVGPLEDNARFGYSLAGLGDLDGDLVPDLAVGAQSLDDGGSDRGGVWLLFLQADGQVKGEAFLENPEAGQPGAADGDLFGASIAFLGDFNGNTLADLAVGATGDRGPVGAFAEGAIWLFELFPDGSVALANKIDSETGGFSGLLEPGDAFGSALSSLGDLDGDSLGDLAVGAAGAGSAGNVWICFLDATGCVQSELRIDASSAAFGGAIQPGDGLGGALAQLGDLDGDGRPELGLGAIGSDDGGDAKGAAWILFLEADGTPTNTFKISETAGGFDVLLDPQDGFGFALTRLGDTNGDDILDLGVSAAFDDDGGPNEGALYLLELEGIAPAKAESYGCVNPPNSLQVIGDPPMQGEDLVLGVDNPLGTQAVGSFGLVLLSHAPDPSYPCGTAVGGFGMANPGAVGEFLVSLEGPDLLAVAFGKTLWGGPGNPSTITAKVPNLASFLGITYYAQGLLYDPAGPIPFGLTDALELRIGP